MAKKYTKSYSNYIIRSNPSATKNGYVYENDLPTTSQKYNTVDGSMITSTDGGFTFVVNTTPDDSKIYNTEGWNQKTFTLGDLNPTIDDFKKIDNSDTKSTIKNKLYVNINKSYPKLSDYCYFGSSNAMLKSAIDDIILNFPAGLYLTSTNNLITSGNTLTMSLTPDLINGYIENKFLIDILNYSQEDRLSLNYNLRTMITSYMDFEIINQNEELIGYINGFTGYTSGGTNDISFSVDQIRTTGETLIIRPIESKRNEFFNNLDDFQKLLLNQYSIPKYKSSFIIPRDSDDGFSLEYKYFTWKTSDGYNIDISSSDYLFFITELIDATNFIDEIYNDNLYRMLTHDTIKNLDSTYSQEIDEEVLEDIIVGGTKIQKILRLYGRSFDELKKYIEGISFVNTITYDGLNNLPTEYLSNKLDVSGWDVFSLTNNISSTGETFGVFPGMIRKYMTSEVNDLLTKNIIINSPYIFKSKGTRKSIRKLFGLLGIDESWYEINEYTQLVDSLISGSTVEEIARLNYVIYPDIDDKEEYEYSFDESLFDNTNVGIFVKCPYCGNEDYVISGNTDNIGICTNNTGHTFNITGNTIGYPKPLYNSGQYYFQQKGNWYRETGGIHTNFSGTTSYVNEINYGNNPHIGDGEYDNGYDYINQFSDVFKRFIRDAGNENTPPTSGYTDKGFFVTNKKNSNNIKISNNTIEDGRLTLNLKNFVIGFDGDKILQSFFSNNNDIQTISIGIDNIDINGLIPEYLNIETYDSGGVLTLSNINNPTKIRLSDDSSTPLLVDYNYEGDVSGVTINQGETYKFEKIADNNWVVKKYNGEDEFNLLKSISLPYVEQIIPSTTIFDFVLISEDTPKWLLVDEYCERDQFGYFTGYKILAYQNINYFDTTTSGVTEDLINLIKEDFGEGYIHCGSVEKKNIMLTEDGNPILMENGSYSSIENDIRVGFDNVYLFKKASSDCGLNTNAIWEIDTTLINT